MATSVPSEPPQLDSAVVEAVVAELLDPLAQRVVELMKQEGVLAPPRPTGAQTWLDAGEVATRLGVTRDWVYEHARELGAIRIGTGRRPLLRFPPDLAAADHNGERARKPAPKHASRRRSAGLIPVYDG